MNIRRRVNCNFRIVLLVLAGTLSALGQQSLPPGFPSNIQLGGVVHGERAIGALGERLPEVAAFYRKTPDQLRAVFRADQSLKADPQGRLFYTCNLHGEAGALEQGAILESISPVDNPPFSTNETFLLHSRPGANRVIYLDFDGHRNNSSGWGSDAFAPPFDLDGDTNSFNSTERDRIVYIWQRVAEDYSMYEIDVTTEFPGIEALRKTSASDSAYGIRVVIGGSWSDWRTSSAGGVAYVGSFDASSDVPCWVFAQSLNGSERSIAEAATHEAGHTLGLIHDGTTTGSAYYSGHGNWAPIMGVGYYERIVQWSKGEYANANNTEDDLAVMLNYGAVYRTDDHGNSIASATVLATGSTNGVIERNTDLDCFRFTAAGGSTTISVLRAPRDSNLHMQVILYDSTGAAILTNTPTDSSSSGTRSAVNTLSLAAGDYSLSVAGVGTGDPLTNGYSDYASLGQYTVSVSGLAPSGPVWVPVAAGTYSWTNTPNWSSAPPNAAGATASVNNNITGNQTINLPTAVTLGTLNLGDANDTHTFAIRPAGGSLTFNNGAAPANLNKPAGTNDLIAAPVTLVGPLSINHSADGTLTLAGAIGGAGSFAKDGLGTTALAGTNTYSGDTTVLGGVLRLDHTNALPAANLLLAGGVLGLASGDFLNRSVGTNASQVRWSDDGGFAAYGAPRQVRFSTNSINWNSPNFIGQGHALILAADDSDATLQWLQDLHFAGAARTVQVNDGSADIDATISGAMVGGLATNYVTHFTKSGAGTLALTAQPTYWGDTLITDGTLMLGDGTSDSGGVSLNSSNIAVLAGATLAVNRTDTLTQGGDALRVAVSGEGGFAQVGPGITVLTLPNSYAGPTTISRGTLRLGAAEVIPDGTNAGAVTVTGTLDLNGFSETINGLGGGGVVDTTAGGTPTLTVGAGDASSTFAGTIRNTAGTLALLKTGTGTLELQGSNTFSGGVIIKNGTVNSRITTHTLGTGTVVMGGIGSTNPVYHTGKNHANAFTINAAATGTCVIGANGTGSGAVLSGPITLNGNLNVRTYADGTTAGITLAGGVTGAGNLTLNNLSTTTGKVTLSDTPVNHTGAITNLGIGTNANVISAVIGTNVTGVIQNSATTPLILSAANTYPGPTTITAGTLRLGAGEVVPHGAGKGNVSVAGTLDLNGFSESLNGLTGNGTVDNKSATAATLTLTTAGGTFSGNIQNTGGGALALFKTGATDVILTGGNTYSGPTTVDQGRLFIGSAGAFSPGTTVQVNSNATFVLNAGGTPTNNQAITLRSGARLSMRQAAILNNVILPAAGSVVLNFDDQPTTSFTLNSGVALTNDLTFQVGGNNATIGAVTLAGAVSGNGGLVKTSAGTLILAATNTYPGPTTVNAGRLTIKVASLAAGSTVSVASNAVLQLDFPATNVVAGFRTNGVSLPAGVYHAANAAPFIAGPGSLLVAAVGPARLTNSLSGNTLSLSWPPDQGWRLQMQTNKLEATNWVDVAGSSVSSTNIPIDSAHSTVFYRLVRP